MADSCLISIDNILGLLDGIEIDVLLEDTYWSERPHAYSTWVLLYSKKALVFLRALMCYVSNWSSGGDDEADDQDLASLVAVIDAALKGFEAGLPALCAEANEYMEGFIMYANEYSEGYKIKAIERLQHKIRKEMSRRVGDALDALARWAPSPPLSHVTFHEFVTSVQTYLEYIPDELDAYYYPGHPITVVQFYNSRFSGGSRRVNGWPSSQVHECVATIIRKLQILECFLQNFAKCCIDSEEKLQPCLALAGPFVFSIAHLSWKSLHARGTSFPFDAFSGISDKISPQNHEVQEIYLGVQKGYTEILKALKPSSTESTSSLRVERDLISSFLNFIHSTMNRVHILDNALAFPFMDLIDTPRDLTEDLIQVLLKMGIAAVVREAGSLDQLPDDLAMGTNFVLLKLWLKIKLIKAEVFLLALHNQMDDVTDQASVLAAVSATTRSLGEFFKTPQLFLEESEKLILARIEGVLREATSICNSYQPGSITEDVISKSSVAILKLFKAEATLMVLINNKDSKAFLTKFQIRSLYMGLILLTALISDPPNKNLEEDGNLRTFLEDMAREAAFLICSLGEQKMEEHLNRNISLLHSCLARIIDLSIPEAFYQACPLSLFANFPRSDGFGFSGRLLITLRELLTKKPDTIAFMEDQVLVFMKELELVMSLGKDVPEQLNENTDLGRHVICLIHEAKYVIDLFVTGGVPQWYHQLMIFNLVLETKLVKDQVLELHESDLRYLKVEVTTPNVDETIIGVNDQAQIIIDQLWSGTQHLDIVSIVGMAGLGKTTLAKRVYSDTSIRYHFNVRAWCCVSQVYRKRELMLGILGCFVDLTDKIMKMDDGDLSQTLRRGLKKKRFLVVMDDVWTIEPWNDLRGLLPDDENGSRVLFTSRLGDVAMQVNPARKPHPLRVLDDKESWELLLDRVFYGGSCSEELLEVSGQIASSCKGLPLAIVVVAGLLKARVNHKDWWNEIAKSLRSHILDDPNEQVMHILEKSYNHLPQYLKPCFLYLGAFLEDTEISAQKLKLLWIAEGFVPKEVGSKSFEEIAENYMKELIGRSLLMESKRRSNGGTKACRMHDMVRDLCLEKARKENFMQLVSRDDKADSNKRDSNPSSSDSRLCVHSAKEHFSDSLLPVGPNAHSLLFLAVNNGRDLGEYYSLSVIFRNFKLLRVLDLEAVCFNDTNFPSEIELMFRLRYLAIKGNISSVPSSIAKLWNLETLIIKGTRGEIELPATLWSMEKLKHLQVHPRASFTLPGDGDGSMVLAKLSTLSSPAFTREEDAEKLLTSLTGLEKLRCIFFKNWNHSRNCNVFPVMGFLSQLQSLNILYHDKITYRCEFSFPKNLKKLTLSNFRLPWEYISAISQLPNLEVLKLIRALEGQTWDMGEEEFPNLTYLKIESWELETWNASSDDHFPVLERLVLVNCKMLEEVPSSFGEIPTLEMIEMHWCNESAAKSMESIYEQQLDYENADFKVMISPPEWDFRA